MKKSLQRVVLRGGVVSMLALLSLPSHARRGDEEIALVKKEIADYQSRIETVEQEISNNKKEIAEDKEDFQDYLQRQNAHIASQAAERDSLKKDFWDIKKKSDAVARQIRSLKVQQGEFDFRQKNFTDAIMKASERLEKQLLAMPPELAKKELESIDFLQGEISAGGVTNTEALERLYLMFATLTDKAETIEIFTEQAPGGTELTGSVDYVRIGLAYIACVNEDGTKGAIWKNDGDDKSGWQDLQENSAIESLARAVKMRRGKALPEIVQLPFDHKVIADVVGELGGVQ